MLSYSDSGSGSIVAAERLFTALRQNGIDAVFGVAGKRTINNAVILLSKSSSSDNSVFYRIIVKIFRKILSTIVNIFNRVISIKKKIYKNDFKTSNPILHSTNTKTLIDIGYINNSDYDLIHLHWVNADTISIEDIAKIKKPIVWTMHDSWVFSGAEHYPNVMEQDNRFIEGYTKNNKPKTTLGPDICRKTWERKMKAWKNTKFHFISPSNYEKESFEKSALFRNSQSSCIVIPNIVPENIFKPIDNKTLKELYQIPSEKKVIGFGSASVVIKKESVKGEYLLLDSLKRIHNKSDYHFIVFGDNNNSFSNELQISTFSTGFILNPYILAGIYNLCDVFVCPSLIESFGLVCLESLFCGIPVAAFNTGGIPDMVEHKKTGYLAKCFDTEDLFNGITYCIDNHEELSHNALIKTKKDFGNKDIVQRHIDLYKSILNVKPL
jgi:glycosyltransferase involved in cell wall biosynthesis